MTVAPSWQRSCGAMLAETSKDMPFGTCWNSSWSVSREAVHEQVSHQRYSAKKLSKAGTREPASYWVLLAAIPCGSPALEELPILQKFGDGCLMLQELDAGESLGLKEYEAEEAVLPQQEPVR
ncbi:hypothetical protein mRhiFer1_008416 [Rhinolophus ferrumequinum]|uniref:Uncharacterized protein n=1 Tax=Rhinolophus ferrumequinum TaxID=59479 RepID=A0A7J7V806_RHIFE|nr:hypothetical protein mRhiFer1_008416 [Rhinolophus ferrumequinum]